MGVCVLPAGGLEPGNAALHRERAFTCCGGRKGGEQASSFLLSSVTHSGTAEPPGHQGLSWAGSGKLRLSWPSQGTGWQPSQDRCLEAHFIKLLLW